MKCIAFLLVCLSFLVVSHAAGREMFVASSAILQRTTFAQPTAAWQRSNFLKQSNKDEDAPQGAEKIQNDPREMLYGNLESQKWFAEVDEETVCRKREINGVFRFEVEKNGKESWHPLLISRTHTFEAGKVYTFSIQAKANKPATLVVGITRDEGNYGCLGFRDKMTLTKEWQTFSFTFVPQETSTKARFDLSSFHEGVTYEFRAATLKPQRRQGQ